MVNLKELTKYTKNLKVLYAEDEESVRNNTQELLGNFFNYIDCVSNGLEALELFKEKYQENVNFYDIIISDLLMPQLDGYKLSKAILDFNPKQEIIIISAHAEFDDVVNLLNVGVNKFIAKPIKVEALYDTLYQITLDLQTMKRKQAEIDELSEYNLILQARTDDKIKALEEFNNALNLSAIVAKTDSKGIITYINNQLCKISGYSAEELIGQNHNKLNSGNRSSSYYKKLWNTINNQKTYKTIFENRHKNGSLYYVETTINPIIDLHGDIVEFIAVSHDMTELMSSIEQTKKAEKSKEDFFVNISHEMKTPLNSILGFSSLLKKRVKDDSKSLMMVETISQTGDELKSLLDSILDMSKIQNGSLELNYKLFNPTVEFNKCFQKYEAKALEKNQEFQTTINSHIPDTLLGDTVRIIQVVSIILDNAIKFTPELGKVHINISYDTFDKLLVCEIKDNGIGIAKENQKKIFGLAQLDASSNRSYEGSGIGLNIASNLVDIMDGKILLKSIPTRGSLFTVEIPLKEN